MKFEIVSRRDSKKKEWDNYEKRSQRDQKDRPSAKSAACKFLSGTRLPGFRQNRICGQVNRDFTEYS